MANSDAELIQRTLDGDDTAFGFLVDKYKGAVHALAYRKTGNFHTAEDITQDTFLKAYQKLHTLKDWRHFPGWLYRIASRHCLMWHRDRRLVPQPLDKVESGHMDALAWAKHTDQQTRQSVRDGLEALPESQRTVLTLHYLGGMTCEEISRFIGTSRGAVLDRLYRARLQLKKEMIPMMEKTLGAFQFPPTFTQQMMNRIHRTPPTTTPQGNPFLPWIAVTASLVFALLIGLGQQSMTRFQQPYSLDAPEPASRVELIDAPMVAIPETKRDLVHRRGQLNSQDDITGIGPNGTSFSATAIAEVGEGRIDTEWKSMNGPYGGQILSLLVTSHGTLLATTAYGYLFRSTDAGKSWTHVVTGYEHKNWLRSLTQINDTIYMTSRDVLRSTDDGASWKRDDMFGEDPQNFCGVASVESTVYVGSVTRGVLRWDIQKHAWIPMNEGLPTISIWTLLGTGTTLYVATDVGAFRKKAGEDSWQPMYKTLRLTASDFKTAHKHLKNGTPQRPTQAKGFESVTSLSAHGQTLYLAEVNYRLYRSEDGGNSWLETPVEHIRDNPYAFTGTGTNLYVGTGDRGVLQSNDDGRTWKPINTGIVNATSVQSMAILGKTIYATTRWETSRSIDGGASWQRITNGLSDVDRDFLFHMDYSLDQFVVSDGVLYAACQFGQASIYRWSEEQELWVPVSSDSRLRTITSLVIHDGDFYVGTGAGGVFRSTNGGQTWDDLGFPSKDVNVLAVIGKTIFAGTEQNGMLRLKDGNDFWEQLDLRAPIQRINHLPSVGKTLYATGSQGDDSNPAILQSNNGGDSWMLFDSDFTTFFHEFLAVTTDGSALYAAGSDDDFRNCVYRLTAGSDKWELVTDALGQGGEITSLVVEGTTLYAAVDGRGIFWISLKK